MIYEATVQFLDDNSVIEGLLFKVGDADERDDDIFYYLDFEGQIKDFMKKGVEDFIVLNYEVI